VFVTPQQSFTGRRASAVAVKIKLKRMGKIRAPFYRIIVADARTKRDGRAIEQIGQYHPKSEPSFIEVDSERAQYWLSVGAQPTDPVRRIFEITGDWQKFKGLPGTEGTLKTAAARPDKKEAFAAAVAETVKDLKVKGKAAEPKAGAKAAETKGAEGKTSPAKADKGADKSRSRRPAAPDDKAASAQGEPGKPAESGAEQASADKPADADGKSASAEKPAGSSGKRASAGKPADAGGKSASADKAADARGESASAEKPAGSSGKSASADKAADARGESASAEKPAGSSGKRASAGKPADAGGKSASAEKPAGSSGKRASAAKAAEDTAAAADGAAKQTADVAGTEAAGQDSEA
jgi:small subunit ribosomal protein S16